MSHDVVITTYSILAMEFPVNKLDEEGNLIASTPPGPLFKIPFYRFILDEAQSIKNKATRCSLAASALVSERRWCLSGTPIQNTLDDIYSLYRFLKIEPYCNYKLFRQHFYSCGKKITKR